MPVFAETELIEACRVLFSSDVQINRDFLYYLQPSGIKSAYRKKAKETHPDCCVTAEPEEHERRNELFRGVSQAYKLLDSFSSDNHKKLWSPADLRTAYQASSSYSAGQGYGDAQQEQSQFSLPKRHLEAGLYLYYRGVISYAEMIEALVWQRRQRPIIGNIAETWGWLKNADVQAINRHHGRRGRFGARAVDLGYLTPFQVQVLLRHQRQSQKLFGQSFVEQGRLTSAEVEAYIRSQRQHNARYRQSPI
jgi:hypothetical protein